MSIADDSHPLSWSGVSLDIPAPLLRVNESRVKSAIQVDEM